MSSIAIIGKGHSAKRCTKEYVDSFDKVAFINVTWVSGFEKYISDRCHYLFTSTYHNLGYVARNKTISWASNDNWADREYYIENKLGIEKVFNLGVHPEDNISKYLDKNISVDLIFRRRTMDQNLWESPQIPKKNWFPPGGILALDYFIANRSFKKISLVGFDFYEVAAGLDEKDIYNHYYFLDKDNKDESMINEGEKDPNNIKYNNSEFNSHESKKQIDYIITQVKQNPDIEFEIYTNCSKLKEQKFNNLKVL
jgi:hypothetical protein